jgi:ribosomal protein S21
MTAINVEVFPYDGEPQDKLLKRFLKKCKKEKVTEEFLEKTSFAMTRSQKKRAKRKKRQQLLARKKRKYSQ